MNRDQFEALLAAIPVTRAEEGWSRAPADRLLSLHISHAGVGLTVSKVEAVRVDAQMLRARTNKGELYLVSLDDVFAVAVDAAPPGSRKAGFGAGI